MKFNHLHKQLIQGMMGTPINHKGTLLLCVINNIISLGNYGEGKEKDSFTTLACLGEPKR